MSKNKKRLILILVLPTLVGILFYVVFFRANFLKKPSQEKIFESFQSMIKPLETDEMNIIIFTIDTLRADHLECYGYENIQTPNINRLAREGILFEYNIAQAPLTLPSHASILTGTYPLFHGVRDIGEHKESAHGFFIYDAAVRVPLIIRFPENKLGNKVIESQVKSIDIMPTVLNLLGEPIPESVQGESFLPLIMGKEEKERASAYSETYWPRYHYGWSELKSLRKGRYKFIDAPRPELYDVLEDPGEVDNIVNREAALGYEMKRDLESLIERYSAEGIEQAGPKKIDNDSLVKLQALGYIGSFHTSSKEEGGKLADPKDKIELYNEIKLAQFLVTEEKMEEAERKIKDVLNKDESVLEACYILKNTIKL